jgi:tetratricopeptide (TPR) repeat protein
LHSAGRFDDALRDHSEALTLQGALVDAHPAVPQYRYDLAATHVGLGNVAKSRHGSADAERHYRTAVDLCESAVRDHLQNRDYRRRLAGAEVNLSVILQGLTGRTEDAQTWHDRAEGRLEQLFRDDPGDVDTLYTLGMLRVNWAYVLQALGQPDRALADLEKNVTALRAALEREPQDFTSRDVLHRTYGVRAQILDSARRYAESTVAWDQVVATSSAATQNINRMFLAEALARSGAHDRAAAVTEAAAATLADKPALNELYHLATVCGLTATAVRADYGLSADERDRRAGRAAALGVRLLGRAKGTLSAGEWRELRSGLLSDAKFAPLHDDPAFRGLLDGG